MLEPAFYTHMQDATSTYARFVLEPLLSSFGQSMGNALRRTLLSSLPGAAVTYVKVEGAPHLFTTVKGVKESVLDIVLSMKQLKFEATTDGPFTVHLSVKGKGKVYGKDIEGEAKVVNGDVYLAEITDDKGKLEMEAVVEKGYGFVPSEDREKKESGYVAVDSSFSPVKKVNFKVEEARVGRKTNYDRLVLQVWTDGSITPEQAMRDSSQILSQQFGYVMAQSEAPKEESAEAQAQEKVESDSSRLNEIIIDELNLPSRVINALLRENIETVADLKKRGREKLVVLKGVGRKSIDLIEEELKKMGIELQ